MLVCPLPAKNLLNFMQFFEILAKLYAGAPLPWPKIFSISCSFWENLAKLYVGALPPPPWPKNFLNLMQFFGNFGKIVSLQPLESQRHLQWEILNLSLLLSGTGTRGDQL